jgi:DNA-binding transcriptional regulator YiaG
MGRPSKSSTLEKKPPNLEIMDSVRKLRRALDETQPVFAKRLGIAMSSLVRYESTRQPHGAVLAHLTRIAEEHHQPEYARIFRKALADEIGTQVQPKIDWRSDKEQRLVLGLLATLRNEQYKDLLGKVEKLLDEPCRRNDEQLEEFRAAENIKRIIFNLLEEGRSADYIIKITGASAEAVEKAANWQRFYQSAKRVGLIKDERP